MTEIAATGAKQFGGLPSEPIRFPETDARYREVFDRLWKAHLAPPGAQVAFPAGFALWLVARRTELSRSSFRQYRAASLFVLAERSHPAIADHCRLDDCERVQSILKATVGKSTARTGKLDLRTSAEKAELVFVEDWDRLIAHLKTYRSRHALSVRLLLSAGLCTGLRPSEWLGAALACDEAGVWELDVLNGKSSNNRSHGPTHTQRWYRKGHEVEAMWTAPGFPEAFWFKCYAAIEATSS